ncbi:hypothetical protein [Streptomyces sp. NPDC056549]|uniref:hypothetical protein n=1 Tax=Streptomyces sp. NPDC056549 TaxID=3345864 RepID=UPI0036C06B5A
MFTVVVVVVVVAAAARSVSHATLLTIRSVRQLPFDDAGDPRDHDGHGFVFSNCECAISSILNIQGEERRGQRAEPSG